MQTITIKELSELCKERLKDAEILIKAQRYDGAYYLCGYVIELALKKRICKTLNWDGFSRPCDRLRFLTNLFKLLIYPLITILG